jgi:hypothetical protein
VGRSHPVVLHAVERASQVLACELPVEGTGNLLVVRLKAQDAICDLAEAGEIIRSECLSLHDGQVDLYLIEPACMQGQMHQHQVRPSVLEAVDGTLATVDGAVVNDPEHPGCRSVGSRGHHLSNQPIEVFDGRALNDVPEQPGPMDIPGHLVGADAMTTVFVFNPHQATGSGRADRMASFPDLKLGLLVRAQDEVVGAEGLCLPDAMIQIECPARSLGKLGITGEDPTAPRPGPEGIIAEPPPDRGAADLGHDPAFDDFSPQVLPAPARKRTAGFSWQCAGQCLDLTHDPRGKRPQGVLCAVGLPAPRGAQSKSAFATC